MEPRTIDLINGAVQFQRIRLKLTSAYTVKWYNYDVFKEVSSLKELVACLMIVLFVAKAASHWSSCYGTSNVISVLESLSGPSGLHENTFLLVLGDHGQTLNGNHGGGSAEEVETSIFAMSFKKPLSTIPAELGISCEYTSLDFAVTVSALLGIPFPFRSIGRVNPELYALAAGTWNMEKLKLDNPEYHFKSAEWLHNYVNVLCINA
ncbi:Aldo_ket_red domain-containing protein [Psidium guajava]|nr:Aldo_ket_red domain-containing protein [Psidium guajava]